MPVTNPDWRGLLVPIFLTVQLIVVTAMVRGEHPPNPPAPDRFPAQFGLWKLFREDPTDAATVRELSADSLVSQTYNETSTGRFAGLLVAWFRTQSNGVRQPHSPRVCLPGAGWTPRLTDEVTVQAATGALTVNRYVVDKGERRAVILYWYQTPRRVIAGEWAAKFWVAADGLRDKRTDTALVRVIAWQTSGGSETATAVASAFTRDLYPALREYLPH